MDKVLSHKGFDAVRQKKRRMFEQLERHVAIWSSPEQTLYNRCYKCVGINICSYVKQVRSCDKSTSVFMNAFTSAISGGRARIMNEVFKQLGEYQIVVLTI